MRDYKIEVFFNDGGHMTYECKDYHVFNGILDLIKYNGHVISIPLTSIKYYDTKEY